MKREPRKLLVIDTSYAWEHVHDRGLEHSVTCRDLDGYFERVWTVHPFASLVETRTKKYGRPEIHHPGERHVFVDGKVGRSDALRRFPKINFVASQTSLFIELARLVKRERISAIRVGDPLYIGVMGLALSRLCGVPLVIRVNANYDEVYRLTGKPMMPRLFRRRSWEKSFFGFVLSRADLVAAVNQDNLDFALANGARSERSTIFRYGNLIDKRHLTPPETRDPSGECLRELWPSPRRFLLNVGRLEPAKLPDEAIRVFAAVRAKGHDVDLLIVGDGTMRARLEELARELGVAEHVVFAGNRGQDFLSRVIPHAAAVISPITGRALTECAFGAAPIVGYDLDWQREVLVSGKTGELVPAGDVEQMAERIDRFLRDPDYARQMGRGVREHAFQILEPSALDQHERDEYDRLLARNGRM